MFYEKYWLRQEMKPTMLMYFFNLIIYLYDDASYQSFSRKFTYCPFTFSYLIVFIAMALTVIHIQIGLIYV